jgi:hypothetical protein
MTLNKARAIFIGSVFTGLILGGVLSNWSSTYAYAYFFGVLSGTGGSLAYLIYIMEMMDSKRKSLNTK